MAGGYTMYRPTEDKSFMSKTEMEENIVSLLGGRVAEEFMFKEITTGGTYYIISKDISDNTSTLETINYYQIKFEVENAEVPQDKILVSKEIISKRKTN